MMNKDLVGQTLLGQFRVDAFVESGGMAAVYRVWDLKRNVSLAMKVLHADLADEPAVLKRFQREADALKKLTHPHIVPFYGMYQDSGSIFLLERFVDGLSLKDIMRKQQGKPLSINESLIYLKTLCASLGYAHANGMVHCDVKPGNVMIDLSGSIYLTDFGIARYSESTTTSLGVAGTPAYMAPEQIRGETVSPPTDVYALGVLSFELLTGRRPFLGTESSTQRGGTTVNERIRFGQLNVPPPDLHSINPEISEGISNVVLRCLKKRPADRFQSTQEFFEALCLEAAVTADDVTDRVIPIAQTPSTGSVPTGTIVVDNVFAQSVSRRKINPLVFGGVVIGFLLLGILAVQTGGMSFGGILTDTPQPTATMMPTSTPTPLPTVTSTAAPPITWSNRSVANFGCSRTGSVFSAGIDSTGLYYLGYFCDDSDRLMVVNSNSRSSWTPFITIKQNAGEKSVGPYLTLNISKDNSIYLSYQVWVKNAEGNRGPEKAGFFSSAGKGTPRGIGQNMDIYDMRSVLDSNDIPHYVVLTKSGDIFYGSNGNLLEMEKVDSNILLPDGFPKTGYFPLSLAVNATGQPYICFSKSGQLQCRYKKGSSLWELTEVPANGIFPSLQIDKNSDLHLAFYDYKAQKLGYAFYSLQSSSWRVDDNVDLAVNTGLYPSLRVDSNGIVHISYYDEGNSALKYAYGQFGEWSTYQVDNDGDVGMISSLLIDSQNNPAIAYYEAESRQIYFTVGQWK